MQYKITVEKIEEVPDKSQSWKQYRNKAPEDESTFKYVTAPEGATRTVKTVVMEQTVDELDLKKVIVAVNNLEGRKG